MNIPNEAIREAKAEAWDEGKRAGWIESETRVIGAFDNPYQEEGTR